MAVVCFVMLDSADCLAFQENLGYHVRQIFSGKWEVIRSENCFKTRKLFDTKTEAWEYIKADVLATGRQQGLYKWSDTVKGKLDLVFENTNAKANSDKRWKRMWG